MRLRNALVVYMKGSSREHEESFSTVTDALLRDGIRFEMVQREKLEQKHMRSRDLIISLGGDGTFLSVAQKVLDSTPMLGVNSDPRRKEGFFLHTTAARFGESLKKILNNEFLMVKATRVQAMLDGRTALPPALNEYFVGSRLSYKVSHYEIDLLGEREYQKSSGVIVSTGSGSHCWVRSSGGKVFGVDANRFQVHVREPYYGSLHRPLLLNRLLAKGKSVTIHSLMDHGVVVADSLGREYPLPKGSAVRIRMSDKPLRMIMFERKAWKGLKSGKRL